MNKEKSKKVINDLVRKFKNNLDHYKKSSYNEASLRIDFLNKFFKALGWDVENDDGLSPSFREVKTEASLEVEGRPKFPDYSFRSISTRLYFYVEAKRPNVNIPTHSQSAFQLRRYGWSANLGISILTSFEHLAIYSCFKKPEESQKANYARLKLIHFEEYLKDFNYLWNTLSKDAVNSGSLDQFEIAKNKKGSLSVDQDFLINLDEWRIKLSKNIFNNYGIDDFQLNNIVQKIIDRIMFLRIAEDRNIEHYKSLFNILKSVNIFTDFLELCNKANEKYNSDLFVYDPVLRSIGIDNSLLNNIIEELYFPRSPYEFSVIPIDILGKSYEQFLGKEIVIDSQKKLSIQQKPEVKKAGGVYYTPKYIVDSIVENTLGKLIKGKKPSLVEKIKVLDPACGSGTFLLGAFEYLLDWYRDYYSENKSNISKKSLSEIITP